MSHSCVPQHPPHRIDTSLSQLVCLCSQIHISCTNYPSLHSQLAHAEKKGIEEAGGEVVIFQVPETLSPEVLEKMHAAPKYVSNASHH